MTISVYTDAEQRKLSRIFPDLLRSRHLLLDLVSKELRARYRNAAMGFVWAILQPVLMMSILTVIFGYIAFGLPQRGTGKSYAIFLLCGLVPWQFFSSALVLGTQSLLANGTLIKKVYFPREVIPIAAVLNALVNALIGFATLAIVMVVLEGVDSISIHWLYVPAILGIQVVLVMGLAMMLSAWNVYYHDVGYMLEVALAFGFYASPIIYALPNNMASLPVSPTVAQWLYRLYMLNPMASLITLYRDAICKSVIPDIGLFAWAAFLAIVIFLLGLYIFRRHAPTFADHL